MNYLWIKRVETGESNNEVAERERVRENGDANAQTRGAAQWSGARELNLFDHWKLHFRWWFNAFMSIILPLFTIPLEILCIYFSNAFTSVRYTHILYALRRPNAPFPLVISKNVFIYVSNNSLLFWLVYSFHSRILATHRYHFRSFISFLWPSNICGIAWRSHAHTHTHSLTSHSKTQSIHFV